MNKEFYGALTTKVRKLVSRPEGYSRGEGIFPSLFFIFLKQKETFLLKQAADSYTVIHASETERLGRLLFCIK
ncbi:hypothetical protein D3C80_1977820 [compost metagenome]